MSKSTNASFSGYRVPRMRDVPKLDLFELDENGNLIVRGTVQEPKEKLDTIFRTSLVVKL